MIKVFEAFAGYGSTCFALKELGIEHELVGFSEIDKYAIQVFQQNHGGINFGDITKIDWKQVPDFDLLTGGFPCQAFSTAGKQQGEADARGLLGLELTKALQIKQPKYFLFENVKGFTSKRFQPTFVKFVDSWSDACYTIFYKVLNTKDFGVPQNRERIWFIGIRDDVYKVGDWKSFPDKFDLKLKLKDILEDKVDEKYFLRQEQVDKLFKHLKTQKEKGNGFGVESTLMNILKESSALASRDYKQPKCIELTTGLSDAQRIYSAEGYSKTLKGLGGGMGAKTGLYLVDPKTHKQYEDVTPCLRSGIGSGNKFQVSSISLYPRSSVTGKGGTGTLVKQDGASYCLDSGNAQAIMTTLTQATGNRAGSSKEYIAHVKAVAEASNQVRRLTPKECFRLQGFLNDQINLEGLSDTQKYKLAGNGQSINVVKLILKGLIKSD